MFRLRVLGGAAIEREDGVVLTGQVAQRHRLALLALLATTPAPGVSRDKLIGLLWPESDAERGRNLLKASVYVLRKALGENALLSGPDDLRLNPDVVGTDVADFEGATARGDHEAGVALYRGPFLDGFFLADAPELERWIDRERERLARSYAGALEALAEAAERQGDFQRASEWWRTRAAHDPYDSRVALCLMRALDASGNRAGALQHASVHERLLQQELGIRASSEVAALAERLRAEPVAATSGTGLATVSGNVATGGSSPSAANTGTTEAASDAVQSVGQATLQGLTTSGIAVGTQPYMSPERAVGDRALDDRTATPHDAGTRASAGALGAPAWETHPGPVVPARRRARTGAFAIAAVVIGAALLWALRPALSGRERSVAVLPFVNMSPQADLEYFSDGVTEEIINELSALPTLKVISRTSVMQYKGSTKPLRQIAGELGVDHVLEGSVRREGDRVRITAQLIDARSDTHLWSDRYDRGLIGVFAVQEDIARQVGRALEVKLQGDTTSFSRRGTRDPAAYELYLRGRFLWHKRTKEGHDRAIEYFQQAIDRDPTYADAHAGLADVYFTAYQRNFFGLAADESETYARIRSAAERAVALDDQSAAAHTSMAMALWWQRDWPGAERELRRAIELNPSYAIARSWYSILLGALGRLDEAVRESRRAYELDPFALVVSSNHAGRLFMARQYDRAIEQHRRTLEIDDTWGLAHRGIGVAYARKGMHAEAVAALRQAMRVSRENPEFPAELAYVLALAGQHGEARSILREVKTGSAPGHEGRVAFAVGSAHMALGEPDSAFAWLERADWRWAQRASPHDPTLDPLRGDPRFAQLSTRVAREMGVR